MATLPMLAGLHAEKVAMFLYRQRIHLRKAVGSVTPIQEKGRITPPFNKNPNILV